MRKVAKKLCKLSLFSQLSAPIKSGVMGAKICAKSLETFTFDNNRAIWSKNCVANVARGKLHGGNNTGSGSGKKHKLFSRVTQPIHNSSSHRREPHTTHTTPSMDMDNEKESIDNQSEEVAVAAAAAAVNNTGRCLDCFVAQLDEARKRVGRTHIIVRFQAGNRRKDHGTENFGGFVYV